MTLWEAQVLALIAHIRVRNMQKKDPWSINAVFFVVVNAWVIITSTAINAAYAAFVSTATQELFKQLITQSRSPYHLVEQLVRRGAVVFATYYTWYTGVVVGVVVFATCCTWYTYACICKQYRARLPDNSQRKLLNHHVAAFLKTGFWALFLLPSFAGGFKCKAFAVINCILILNTNPVIHYGSAMDKDMFRQFFVFVFLVMLTNNLLPYEDIASGQIWTNIRHSSEFQSLMSYLTSFLTWVHNEPIFKSIKPFVAKMLDTINPRKSVVEVFGAAGGFVVVGIVLYGLGVFTD